jgi:hypothetical protein
MRTRASGASDLNIYSSGGGGGGGGEEEEVICQGSQTDPLNWRASSYGSKVKRG